MIELNVGYVLASAISLCYMYAVYKICRSCSDTVSLACNTMHFPNLLSALCVMILDTYCRFSCTLRPVIIQCNLSTTFNGK